MDKLCKCGCNRFRFKEHLEGIQFQEQKCRNCSHMFSEHVVTIRSAQAE